MQQSDVRNREFNLQRPNMFETGYGQKSKLFKINILERSKKVNFSRRPATLRKSKKVNF